MRFHVRCLKCGAKWWCRGSYENGTNATILDDTEIHEGQCGCGEDVEIIDSEYLDGD